MNATPGKLSGDGEHRSITLGDLTAVIVGVAVVLVLPRRQSYWPYPVDFLGPWPGWLPWCFCLRQALGAACLVLVPIVLRRRAVYGGLARPVEFLALCAAMPFLTDGIETGLLRLSYRLHTGIILPGCGTDGMSSQFSLDWWYGGRQVFKLILVPVGAASLAAFFLGRRRWPGWLLTALLSVAWLGAYEAGPLLTTRLVRLIAPAPGPPLGVTAYLMISAVVAQLPRFVLYSGPAIVAVRDVLGRVGRTRPTWLEWTALGLAVTLFLVAEPTELIRGYSTTGPKYRAAWVVETLVRATTMLAALILGFYVPRIAGRAQGGVNRDHRPT